MTLKKWNLWNYKGFEIEESSKPGTDKFQYFFRLKEADTRKCTYCIWITADVVNAKSNKASMHEKFEDVIESDREIWVKWVKNKIDQGIFSDFALEFSASGENEINLSEAGEKIEF